jgi:hypothetical protein
VGGASSDGELRRQRLRLALGIFTLVLLIVGVVIVANVKTGCDQTGLHCGPASSGRSSPAGEALVTRSSSAGLDLAPSSQVGLFEDLQYLRGRALEDRLNQYAALGLRWARFQMIWGTVQEEGPDSYRWGPYDAVISGLLARGIQPLVVIDTSPSWDRLAGCSAGLTCAPSSPSAYAAFAAAAVRRYAPLGVHAWEIWNEPNNGIFWSPSPDAQAYTMLLRRAYTAIKQVDPTATVISGGLAPEVTSSGLKPVEVAPLEFLASVYADGGGGSFDAVGWHPYTYPALPGSPDPGSAWYQMYGTLISMRSLMVANGDAAKRVWATEFGAPTDPRDPSSVDYATQALMFSRALALWSAYPWAGPFIGYQFQDRGTNTANEEDFFGLVTADGVPKPSYYSFQAAVTVLQTKR